MVPRLTFDSVTAEYTARSGTVPTILSSYWIAENNKFNETLRKLSQQHWNLTTFWIFSWDFKSHHASCM